MSKREILHFHPMNFVTLRQFGLCYSTSKQKIRETKMWVWQLKTPGTVHEAKHSPQLTQLCSQFVGERSTSLSIQWHEQLLNYLKEVFPMFWILNVEPKRPPRALGTSGRKSMSTSPSRTTAVWGADSGHRGSTTISRIPISRPLEVSSTPSRCRWSTLTKGN